MDIRAVNYARLDRRVALSLDVCRVSGVVGNFGPSKDRRTIAMTRDDEASRYRVTSRVLL